MGMAPKVGIRAAANFIILLVAGVVILGSMLIVAGMLGHFLLGFALMLVFALIMYFTQGAGISGPWILLTLLVLFGVGYGAQNFMASTIGYDPGQAMYISGMSAIKLGTVGYTMSDSEFSMISGFAVIVFIVVLAMVGMFYSQAKHGRR